MKQEQIQSLSRFQSNAIQFNLSALNYYSNEALVRARVTLEKGSGSDCDSAEL